MQLRNGDLVVVPGVVVPGKKERGARVLGVAVVTGGGACLLVEGGGRVTQADIDAMPGGEGGPSVLAVHRLEGGPSILSYGVSRAIAEHEASGRLSGEPLARLYRALGVGCKRGSGGSWLELDPPWSFRVELVPVAFPVKPPAVAVAEQPIEDPAPEEQPAPVDDPPAPDDPLAPVDPALAEEVAGE